MGFVLHLSYEKCFRAQKSAKKRNWSTCSECFWTPTEWWEENEQNTRKCDNEYGKYKIEVIIYSAIDVHLGKRKSIRVAPL